MKVPSINRKCAIIQSYKPFEKCIDVMGCLQRLLYRKDPRSQRRGKSSFLQDEFLGLQTFPVFAKKKEIKTRYILLEAYLLTRRYSKIFPKSLSKSCTASCYKERIFEYQGRQHSSLDMEAKAAASRTSALYRYSSIICSKLTQDSNFF